MTTQFFTAMKSIKVGACVLLLSTTTGCGSVVRPGDDLFSFDILNQDLAKRVKDQILGPNNNRHADFIVGLTSSADPIGTIYNSDSWSRAISRSACVEAAPMTVDAFYFPSSYTISREAAAQLGLDQALTRLAKLGIDVDFKRGLTLSFSKNKQSELDDNQVRNVVSLNQICKAAINGKEVRFVRGYVSVKRNFTASSLNAIDVTLGAEKIGTLTIKPLAAAKEIKIVDEEPARFIQIIQLVKGEASGGTPAISDKGLVYIQIDATDSSRAGDQLTRDLQLGGYAVSSDLEKISHEMMPKVSQVRYFNDSDKAKADQVLGIVRRLSPDAITVRLGLPAPAGQIEVWLTR